MEKDLILYCMKNLCNGKFSNTSNIIHMDILLLWTFCYMNFLLNDNQLLIVFLDSVILLQTGQTRSTSKSSEILDPKTQEAISCNVEDYPIEVEEAAGDLVGGIPMACGGYQGGSKGPTRKCFKLVAGQWIESGEMSVVRRRHAAIEVTVSGEKALWVTG